MAGNLSAVKARAQDLDFVTQCSLWGLQEQLPLCWPTPANVPPSPKNRYRSQYVYLGWQDLQDPAAWDELSDFDLVLRLVDFSGLRPVLAQRLGWTSLRGQVPFDPVSIFLLHGWQITNGWSRAETLRNLAKKRYADYAERFGFAAGLYPTEGGLRYFLTALGLHSDANGDSVSVKVDEERTVEVAIQYLNQLLAGAVTLICEADLLSPEVWSQAQVCPDGMLHHAACRLRCASVRETCYQPTTPSKPRPCPAKEKERQGCDCETWVCADACCQATPWDAEARFVWYTGSNQPKSSPNRSTDPAKKDKKGDGEPYYGYRSLPLLLSDPYRRFHLTLLGDFLAANGREEVPATALLLQLSRFYPDLNLDAVAGDAGFGYDVFLRTIYTLGAKRIVDLRAHDTDKNKEEWPIRGYDDRGRPLCPFGYAFTANGFDVSRQRYKWFCAKACLQAAEPLVSLDNVSYPPGECGYQDTDHPYGQILNLGERFANGSIRLARDLPVGSPAWKRIYHRARNASEARNATFMQWGLKRLPVYGGLRGKAVTFLADTWSTLTTLARLVREATLAACST
ncbi:MAG: hypothetical protein PVF77_17645 [Anaerolineae bacterium]|jgi:hypothetical protein